jgi:hypothetical protein
MNQLAASWQNNGSGRFQALVETLSKADDVISFHLAPSRVWVSF